MIPKIIHYCWFGGKEKPDSVIKCISSWKKWLPDYKIIEWNEKNFIIDESVAYVKEAYEKRKFAFVSDYARLKALYDFGGLYFDTDVEVFRSFDSLLDAECFFGFESKDYLCTAVMACVLHNSFIKEFLESYDNRTFIKHDGSLDIETTNVVAMTNLLAQKGLKRNGKQQIINGIAIYPQFYFSSNELRNVFHRYGSNIYSYHHCQATWYESKRNGKFWDLFRHYLIGVLRNAIGTDRVTKIRKYK